MDEAASPSLSNLNCINLDLSRKHRDKAGVLLCSWRPASLLWLVSDVCVCVCVCVNMKHGEIGTEETETPTQERRKEISRIMVKGNPKKTDMQTAQIAGVDQKTGRKLFKK